MQSSSKTIGVSSVATVTVDRKKELLMEARKVRVSWVQSSAFPFMEPDTTNDTTTATTNDNGTDALGLSEKKNEPMAFVKKVCEEVKLPSAVPIIELLVGDSGGNSECNNSHDLLVDMSTTWKKILERSRSHELKNSDSMEEDPDAVETAIDPAVMELLMSKTDDPAFLFYYKEVLDRLCLPECADIVQGMRHFEKSFADLSLQLQSKIEHQQEKEKNDDQKNDGSDDENSPNKHLKTLATVIQSYLTKLYDTLSSHSSWRANGISSDTKMMLETFIYAKCYEHIRPKLSMFLIVNEEEDDDSDEGNTKNKKKGVTVKKEEASMKRRLDFLQFVQPKHLDMNAIIFEDEKKEDPSDNGGEENGSSEAIPWQSKLDLSKPISDILTLDTMYSPAQMLRCILEIYRGVNEALSACLKMNQNQSNGSATLNVSADDVLPSLILSVVHAKPNRIISVLTFLEMFATEEQIRGEAGYAYTNLYSAVQFIKALDLNIDETDGTEPKKNRHNGRPTLSMPFEVLQEKIRIFRQKLAIESPPISKEEDPTNTNDSGVKNEKNAEYPAVSKASKETSVGTLGGRVEIPVRELKAARMRGENVRDWATQYCKMNNDDLRSESASGENTGQTDVVSRSASSSLDKFSRSYKFLATDAKDVKVSDIPDLLDEYKMLVQTTEALIMERNSFKQLSQQNQRKLKRRNLESSLEEVMKTGIASIDK